MSISKKYLIEFINELFIAYSYSYIHLAIEAIKENPKSEAIILQPYKKNNNFTSAKKILDEYKQFLGKEGIPILFTPQSRFAKSGQFFEYGGCLLDILDIKNPSVKIAVEKNISNKKWILQKDDILYAENNVLLVKVPIIPLKKIASLDKLPITESYNVLKPNSNSPAHSIAIPAPKRLKSKYKNILEQLLI